MLRFDPPVLEEIQAAYEREIGTATPSLALWDLMVVWRLALAVPSWVWFFELEGRTDGSLDQLTARRDLFAADALEQFRLGAK